MGLEEENGVVGEEEEVVDDALWEGSAQGNGTKKVKGGPSVAFADLFQYADAFDKFLIIAGTVGAVASGLSLPVLLIIQAKLLNSFGTLRGHELYSEACKDDVVRETIVAVGAGSGAGLTEVQIGSAMEGEDEGGLACYRSWKSVKRGFSQIAPEDLGSNGLGTGGMLQGLLDSKLGCMALAKRQKVYMESLSSRENGNEAGERELSLKEMDGDMKTKSVDTGDCDSAVPRVNVLKLRKCLIGKGRWRVAGNSCTADRSVLHSGDGGEPLIPSSISDRKRSFSECLELEQLESPEENGHPASFMEGPRANGHAVSNGDGADEVKVQGMWSNCEVSSIHDVPYNPWKRFKHGPTSSGSSNDSYVPHSRADEAYRGKNGSGGAYADLV